MEPDNISVVIPEEMANKWQDIVDILAEIVKVPTALIMKIDEPYIEVFRSSKTDKNPYKVGDKEHLSGSGLYCEEVIKTKRKLLVRDALKDEKWNKNPDIKLGMVSYLGFLIQWPNGEPFGTICVLDSKENSYNKTYEKLILKFKDIIEDYLTLLYREEKIKELLAARVKTEIELKKSMEQMEAFNKIAVGRELRMQELKKKIQELEAKITQSKQL